MGQLIIVGEIRQKYQDAANRLADSFADRKSDLIMSTQELEAMIEVNREINEDIQRKLLYGIKNA